MKNNRFFIKALSALLAMALVITIPFSAAFAASCKHNMPVGNSGIWLNSKNDVKNYVSEVSDEWARKQESGEITWVEYSEGCPYGYEAWGCAYCGKWTVNFYYKEKTCNHKWSKETTVYEPTCIGNGYTERYCTLCNIKDQRNLPELGHDMNNTIIEPTLTTEGHIGSECIRCGYVFSDSVIPKAVPMSTLPFKDLDNYQLYTGYVAYTSVYNKFIAGTNPPYYTQFSPTASITRAMFVAILYRMAGNPYDNGRNPYKSNPFNDIKTDAYYYNAACWALDEGITNQKTFRPNNAVTREQTARFLFAYAESKNMLGSDEYKNVELNQYPDYFANGSIIDGKPEPGYYPGVSEWAEEPLQWANYNDMITGTSQGYINPQGATQRIHATRILYGFAKALNIGNFE